MAPNRIVEHGAGGGANPLYLPLPDSVKQRQSHSLGHREESKLKWIKKKHQDEMRGARDEDSREQGVTGWPAGPAWTSLQEEVSVLWQRCLRSECSCRSKEAEMGHRCLTSALPSSISLLLI